MADVLWAIAVGVGTVVLSGLFVWLMLEVWWQFYTGRMADLWRWIRVRVVAVVTWVGLRLWNLWWWVRLRWWRWRYGREARAMLAAMAGELVNRDFSGATWHEYRWWDAAGKVYTGADIGEIGGPEGWVSWWFNQWPGVGQDPGDEVQLTGQPEVKVLRPGFQDPVRLGDFPAAVQVFTFHRNQDAGLMQKVQVPPGSTVTVQVFAHSYYSDCDFNPHDPPMDRDCRGILTDAHLWLTVGVDPLGRNGPLASGVVWSEAQEIYGGYDVLGLSASAVAEADHVTIWLRARSNFALKHVDAYWAGVTLTVTPPGPRQYERTYVLLPQDTTQADAVEIARRSWGTRWTVGYSVDDALGGGAEVVKRFVLAYRPEAWGGLDALRQFDQTYYTGTAEIQEMTLGEEPPPPPPPPPPPQPQVKVGGHFQVMTPGWDLLYRERQANVATLLVSFEDVLGIKRANRQAFTSYRHYGGDYDAIYHATPQEGARIYWDYFKDAAHRTCDRLEADLGFRLENEGSFFGVQGPNEVYSSSDNPGLQRWAAMEAEFCKLVAYEEPRCYPIVFNAAVGNPREWEYYDLVDLARACAAAYGRFGYHAYWLANLAEGPDVVERYWPWLAGRWVGMRKVFRDMGVTNLRWHFTEGGAVGGEFVPDARPLAKLRERAADRAADRLALASKAKGMKPCRVWVPAHGTVGVYLAAYLAYADEVPPGGFSLLPLDGWKSDKCLAGDWDMYGHQIGVFNELCREYEDVDGGVLFTTGASWTKWPHFQMQEDEWRKLSASL